MDSSGLAAQATSLCSTPSQIAGLLSKNGQCFIATAAFGSPLQKEVLTFRQFRNRYLLPHKLGRQFVSWYYKHSPPWAQKISDNPSAKAVTRAFLWPLAQILKVVLNWGLGAGLAIVGIVILAPFFIVTRIKKARSLFSSLFFLIITFGLASIVPSLVFAAPQSKLKQPPLLIEKKSEPDADVEEEEDTPEAESPEKIEAEAPKNEDGIEYSNDPDLGVEVPLKEKSIKDQGIMYSEPEKPKSSDDEAINAETIKNPHRKKKNFDDGSPSYRVNAFGDKLEGGKLKKKFRDGTYLYKVKPSPQKYSGGFRIGPYTPADLQVMSGVQHAPAVQT
jgi:hypothetical protein